MRKYTQRKPQQRTSYTRLTTHTKGKSHVTDLTNCMLVFAPIRAHMKERCMSYMMDMWKCSMMSTTVGDKIQ